MVEVSIAIRGRQYQIECQDGQEGHLRVLASRVNKRVEQLAANIGRGNDAMLILMAALMAEDDLLSGNAPDTSGDIVLYANQMLGEKLSNMADYINQIAANIAALDVEQNQEKKDYIAEKTELLV